MNEEDRHADDVNIAFQMGAEWQKKQSDSAWKGIHEGAVLAMQARITELEGELNAITDDAVARVFELEDRIERLEAALRLYACEKTCPNCYGQVQDTRYCGWTARKALGEKDGPVG